MEEVKVYDVFAQCRGLTFNYPTKISVNAYSKEGAAGTAIRRIANREGVGLDSVLIISIQEG